MTLRLAAATQTTLAAAIARLARDATEPAAAVAGFESLISEGLLQLDDILFVHDESDASDIRGVMFAQRLGGAQAALWLPVADDDDVADRLIAASFANLAADGHRILQVVVRIPAPPVMASFARLGFTPVSDLIFLSRDVTPADAGLNAARLTLEPAASSDLAFAELIEQTYVGSLDMPELNETRSAAELLASCRLMAKAEPPLWWYAMDAGQRVGVLQLAPADDPEEFELVYMGFVPEARGQGLGAELARLAVAQVAALGGQRILLSRDARNAPAQRVYDQLGFVEASRRAVWLKISRA